MIAGDFNRCDTAFLSLLNLSNIVNFPTRNNAFLDKIFVNSLKHFNVYLRAPLGSSDHCILKLMPKIYGHLGHIALTKDRHVRVRRRNCDTSAIISLQHMLNSTDFDIFYNPDLSLHVETLSSYLNFILDICCPFETLYIRTDCFSSPKLKQLRRLKEKAYKCGDKTQVKKLSISIKKEIKGLNEKYVHTLIGNPNYRDVWKVIKQLGGLVSKSNQSPIDVDKLNWEFIVDKPLQPVDKFDNVDSSPLFVSPSETLLYLNSLKPSKAAGPDNVSPFLLKKCSHILAEPLSSLLSRCLQERKLPDCWRAVKITPIPKKDSDKFRPIACTSVLLKLLEKFILSKLCTFFYLT